MDLIALLFLGLVVGPYNLRLGLRMVRDPESYQRMVSASSHPLAAYWALPRALPWIRRAGFLAMGSGALLIALALLGLARSI
jgi:hypothetical protein